MILVDTGAFVALFDPRDAEHERCQQILQKVRERLLTTVPVLTEAFHVLDPASVGSRRLRDFVLFGGCGVWFLDTESLERAFELMEKYADQPMDLADASLVTAAETLKIRQVFTVDARDFAIYRARFGRRQEALQVIS